MTSGYNQHGKPVISRSIPSNKKLSTVHKEAIEALLVQKGMKDRLMAVGIATNQLESVVDYVKEHDIEFPRAFILLHQDGGHEGIYWNPKILRLDGNKMTHPEGCLSLQGELYVVDRYSEAIIQYEDSEGKISRKALKGLDAVIAQHEVDHLDGLTIRERGTKL